MWIKACSNLEIGFHSRHWRKKFFKNNHLYPVLSTRKKFSFGPRITL